MRLRYWIEVTSGIRWQRLLEEGVALEAPDTVRYRHFFENLSSGDLVLHYLTKALTPEAQKQSAVVAVSRIASNPEVISKTIVSRCAHTVQFPRPIGRLDLNKVSPKSSALKLLLKMSMQRYLTELSSSDFRAIVALEPANFKSLLESPLHTVLDTK